MLSPTRFQLLNEEHELLFPQAWNHPGLSKLWLYNLHYFDDLSAIDAEDRREWQRALIRQWLMDNAPGCGVGWQPYPLSLRIVNWVKYALAGNHLSADAVHSLAVQTRYLRKTLEYHLLGNHLLSNAKALMFAGCFFQGAEAEEWLAKSLSIFEREIQEQILGDGGHFELSPMYHSLILEDLLDTINISRLYQIELAQKLSAPISRMLNWLKVMTHPDGDIAFFNDASTGITHKLGELEAYAQQLGVVEASSPAGSCLLADSGYARLEQTGAVVLADVAAIGPSYLPGHAHADSLSFELSLNRQRVLVNSGTSVYGVGEERLRQRGTAAHNTVRVDSADSSEIWSGFRVARRARARLEAFERKTEVLLQASHDGYQRLRGKPVHRRSWHMTEGRLVVRDEISGSGEHDVELLFHFHPSLQISNLPHSIYRVEDKNFHCLLDIVTDEKLEISLGKSTWHPEFGISIPNFRICGKYRGALPICFETVFSWSM